MEHNTLEQTVNQAACPAATDAEAAPSQRFGCAMQALARPVARRQQVIMPTWRALGRELWQGPQIIAARIQHWVEAHKPE